MTKELLPGLAYRVYIGNGERLAMLFRATWSALPRRAKERIQKHWRGCADPRVELMDHWPGWNIGVKGQVQLVGEQIRFHAPYIERMSDTEVRFTIAHELAHVLQWTHGGHGWCSYREMQIDADRGAMVWLGLSRKPRSSRALVQYWREEMLRALRDGARVLHPFHDG